MIIGTAGHIDHGKTALVRALTGVDTDRLPEEQRRGITIELGFAPLALDVAGPASLVDVPGHEAFVRTMLAGASGIDLALLVIAADEGVMPQTREHLAILSLLGVRGGVVALTKCDLVDDAEWLTLVAADVADAVAGTPLDGAPVVATSATTGAGIAAVRAALGAAARTVVPRAADDLFRMPVDRAFTVHGTGTVVTGTVWSGTLARDAAVRVLPLDRAARVKGLQSHGRSVPSIGPGQRAAIALAGVDVAEVARGAVLVTAPSWRAGRVWRAEVELLADAEVVLQPRTRVRLHLGTGETSARVVARGSPCEPGTRRTARILLDTPLVARGGDRFVLRSLSPVTTVGGGTVVDPMPPSPRARPWPLGEGDAAAEGVPVRLALLLEEAGSTGVAADELPVRLGIAPTAIPDILGRAEAVTIGGRVLGAAARRRLEEVLLAELDAMHAAAPLDAVCSLQALRARCPAPPEVLESVLRAAADAGALVVEGGTVRRAGWEPRLTRAQAALLASLDAAIIAAGLEPPDVDELTARHGPDVAPLLAIRERSGRLRRVERNRLYAGVHLDALYERLDATLDRARWYTAAELRDVIGTSRKYVIPLLEYLDAQRLTDRAGDGRRWRGGARDTGANNDGRDRDRLVADGAPPPARVSRMPLS